MEGLKQLERVGLDKLVDGGTGVFGVFRLFFCVWYDGSIWYFGQLFWCWDGVFGITQILEGGEGVWMGQDG